MSILNKNALAVALVAGLGMAGTAGAYTLQTGAGASGNPLDALPVLVATADIIDATTDIGVNEDFVVTLTGADFILGRTTGFTVRYSLSNGASFGNALTTADLVLGAAAPFWTYSIVAGGTTTGGTPGNPLVIKFEPNAVPADCDADIATPDAICGLGTGVLLTINGANLIVAPATVAPAGQIIDGLAALQTVGAQVIATVQFVDPVTAAAIMTPGTSRILQSGNPVVQACDANGGDTAKRIDVGVSAQASKTYFSSTGAIGGADAGYINLGSLTASIDPAFTSFNYLFNDEFVTTVTGDFSAFSTATAGYDVFLSSSITCASNEVNGVIDNVNGTVTFTYVISDLVSGNPAGSLAYVCASVPSGNAVVIDASNVAVSSVFTRGAVTSNSGSCDLLPLRYNGSVVDIYHVNPAGNTTAQSFIRVINQGDNDGKVTVTGIDDSGTDAAAPITFVLGAGKSMQINSEDLEFGNAAKGLTGAWGDGAGKWRGTVTGEFGNMIVQSLNRNSTDGTVTNLTDADNNGEQTLNALLNP